MSQFPIDEDVFEDEDHEFASDEGDCGVKITLVHGDDCTGCRLMRKIMYRYGVEEEKYRREQMYDAGYVVGKSDASKDNAQG